MSLPSRDDVDPQYRFDLTCIFETPDEWVDAREALEQRLARLESAAADPPTDAAGLATVLNLTEECYRRKQRLDLYATLSANVNTSSDEAATRQRQFRELEADFKPVVASVRRCLGGLTDAEFEEILSEFDESTYYARNLRTQASRMHEPAVEEAIAMHAEARSAPTRIHRATTTEDFTPPTIERPGGDPVDLSVGNKRTELSHSDRDYRRTVYEAYYEEMERFEATLTRTMAEKLSAAATEAEIRDYDSIRDRDLRGTYPDSGLEPAVPEAVHDTLVATVRDNLEPYHRAQRLRRDRLSVDTLRPWDRRVPTASASPPELEYGDATSLILDALEPLGEEYVDLARTFFSERRIDVFPTKNKRTDIPAYCPSSAADGAFVLANFDRDVRAMFYIVHELGHALTAMLYQTEPTRYATAPMAICEVPSILHEVLLAEHCLDAGGALAAHAHDRLIECLSGNFYRNARSAAFNHKLTTTVEAGDELSPTTARKAYAELLAAFDSIVEFPDGGGHEWLGRGQRMPYSSYQYVLGATGALVVRDRLRDESLPPAEYREFLRTIGRQPPVESFGALGVDVLSDDPYERAAATFDGYLDRL